MPRLSPPPGAPPPWFKTARDRLCDAPGGCSISGLAAELGLHRVYFTRAFQRWSGMAPSAFRIARMADRALAAAACGAPTAQAAADAGFADQSHMTRVVKALTGSPPGRLAALLNGPEWVSSVQDFA